MTSDLLKESKAEFAGFMTRLQNQVESLQPPAPSKLHFLNHIFQAPAASDLFTGRMALLNQVEEAFGLFTYPFLDAASQLTISPDSMTLSPPPSSVGIPSDQAINRSITESSHDHRVGRSKRKQKRFILVGLGGSGKTEFCRKFAEQNQSRYLLSTSTRTVVETDFSS